MFAPPPPLVQVEDDLRAITTMLDPDVLSGSDAQVAMERFARIANMAHAGARLMGRRVADTGVWKNRGHQSAGHAMAKALGCSTSEAHRELGTARKLDGLGQTDAAARRGELSPAQTGHVAGAAAADPAAESDLLALAAKGSATELRGESARRRHAAAGDDAARHRRILRNRSLRMWTDEDGSSRLSWSHLPEVGAEVKAILEAYTDEQFHHTRAAGVRDRRDTYAADGIVEALRDAAAYRRGEVLVEEDAETHDVETADEADEVQVDANEADPPPTTVPEVDDHEPPDPEPDDPEPAGPEGDDEVAAAARAPWVDPPDARAARVPGPFDPDGLTAPPPVPPPPAGPPGTSPSPDRRRKRQRMRKRRMDTKVIVRIDHAALVRGHTEAGETCEIDGIGPVPVESVRALMSDAYVAAVLMKGTDVTRVVNLGRRANAIQNTAIEAKPRACTTLGCPNTERLEIDHRRPWCDTLVTVYDDLDPTCPHCHHLETYDGYQHVPGTGPRLLLSPAEQADWNREHPDQPIPRLDPPGRRGPNHRAPSTPTTDQEPSADEPAPAPEALTLDL